MRRIKFENEQLLNHFVMQCISFTFIGMLIVAILNAPGIFGTNLFITQLCFGLIFLIFVISAIVAYAVKFKGRWLSFFLITAVLIMTYVICSSLTYHAVIISVFPLVYSSVFQDKRLSIYTIITSALLTSASVYIGYYFGVADLNMVFLPINRIQDTVNSNGLVFGSDFIIDGLWWKLLAYIVIPRLIIMSAFSCVCIGISHILQVFNNKAIEMEKKAIHDGMTGLYNKSYFLDMGQTYKTKEKIGIIYLDANNLKVLNDTLGHSAGDSLLLSISTAIHSLETEDVMGYRIGGDEFVVVIANKEETVVKIITNQFRYNLDYISRTNNKPLQASVGVSYGKGIDFDSLVIEAEKKMYEEKDRFHEENPLE